jgi:hypothetical protein
MEIGDITIMPCTVMKNMRIIQYSSTKLIWGGKARIQGIVEDVKKNIYIYSLLLCIPVGGNIYRWFIKLWSR